MTVPSPEGAVDPELQRLVSGLIDHTLTDEEAARLEDRLRRDPAAHRYCAEALRFDADLQESMDTTALSWEETRRVVFDPRRTGKIWSVQREQTLRFGDAPRPGLPAPAATAPRGSRLPLVVLALALVGAIAGGAWYYQKSTGTYALRNGDFEEMDLSKSPTGVDRSLLNWQDYFNTVGAELCEIGRVSGGRIYAKSGQNVVRIMPGAYISQFLKNKRGQTLLAEPGLRLKVSGWCYNEGSHGTLRCALRYVASGYPDMIQYEAASSAIQPRENGWHPFSFELKAPENLWRSPSDLATTTNTTPPAVDLRGQPITLSLDHRSSDGVLYLDDLEIEVLPPPL